MVFLSRIADLIDALASRHRLLPWLIAYVMLLPLPFIMSTFFNSYLIDLANRACLFILLAVGLNIVKGFCVKLQLVILAFTPSAQSLRLFYHLNLEDLGERLDLVCRSGYRFQ